MNRPWHLLGIAMQAVVLGLLLFFAVAKLVSISTGTRVFQYQGF